MVTTEVVSGVGSEVGLPVDAISLETFVSILRSACGSVCEGAGESMLDRMQGGQSW